MAYFMLVLLVVWSVHCLSSLMTSSMVWMKTRPGNMVSPSFQGKLLFPLVYQVGSMWNHLDNHCFSYVGQCHQHAGSQSTSLIHNWNMLFQWVFQCVHHWNAVRWKGYIVSTIVVLSLWSLGGKFPPSMYQSYHSTIIAYGNHHIARLIVIWWVPWYPRTCGHGTIGARPNIIGLRHRPMHLY